jgi:hypothetical protein
MAMAEFRLVADDSALRTALHEFADLLFAGGLNLELDGCSAELREFLRNPALDRGELVRIDRDVAADWAGDVLLALHPSDLFLELLAALRARNVDDVIVEAEGHGPVPL